MRAVQLSNKTNEHYTPWAVVYRVQLLLGGIDLDPFSCAQANKIVGAKTYYSLERGQNGYVLPWKGKVYCNPPGNQIRCSDGSRHNSAAYAWYLLWRRYTDRDINAAVFMCFNLELFRYTQEYPCLHTLEFPICFPDERIKFLDRNLKVQKSPGHPNAIIYLGENVDKFHSLFSTLGKVIL